MARLSDKMISHGVQKSTSRQLKNTNGIFESEER